MANNRFQIRRSSVAGKVPANTDLNIGELGLNITDQILYSTNGTVVFEIGANNTNQKVNGNLSLTVNGSRLSFKPINGSQDVYFTQQNDDNFVFYNTNTSGGVKPVFSVYANTNSPNQNSAFQFHVPVKLNSILYANGTAGGNGQVLVSNGSATYWGTPGTGATFTASNSTPASPNPGDEWLNTDTGILYTYFNDGNSSQWVEWGPYAIQTPDPNIFNLDGGTPTSTYGGLSAIDAGGVT